MMQPLSAVLDIGKTYSKLTLWAANGQQMRRETRSNHVIENDGYDALDTTGIGTWVIETLATFSGDGELGAIIPIAHGAAVAAVRDGALITPPMDYEFPIPAKTLERYHAKRDPFCETGSPALPDG